MRYPPGLLDEIRARLPVSQVVGRRVQLRKRGREYVGLSPFKAEKTPSFTVNDQKGFYHCFATASHGDIFRFVMETEGLGFPEAVERLASEAGVPLPAPSPEAQKQYDERARLREVTEAACVIFQESLHGSSAGSARSYLARRGVETEALRKFRIGYAPGGRDTLKRALLARGFTIDELIRSGMVIGGADIAVPYDRFRDRIMFPICDLKGRVIAFGGRALDSAAPAKYLNSPETPLFHKGHVLFNAAQARQRAYDSDAILVVEGYMDVVALAQAGFENAVAPLGTALTGDQIQLLWRMAPEPTLCFDGDAAGHKAAWRAVDTVLPLLKPGHSLRFVFLPDGLDPDDLIRRDGAEAMRGVLESHQPLVDVLWNRELAAGDWSTPERRALLEGNLDRLVGTIADERVRLHYRTALRERSRDYFWQAGRGGAERGAGQGGPGKTAGAAQGFAFSGWRQSGRDARKTAWGQGRGPGGGKPGARNFDQFAAEPTAGLRSGRLASERTPASLPREVTILAIILAHPWLLDDHDEDLADIIFRGPELSELRDAILRAMIELRSLDSESLQRHLAGLDHKKALEWVQQSLAEGTHRFLKPDADHNEVIVGWSHVLALHRRDALQRDLRDAEENWLRDGSEAAWATLSELKNRQNDSSGLEAAIEGYGAEDHGTR